MPVLNRIINEDCLKTMQRLPSMSVDLVFTSPPYAERRKNSYGGVPESAYVTWFIHIARDIKRVLKHDGSFFLVIKEHSIDGCRSLYVKKLVIALCENVGFKLIDEYCWVKGSMPGKFVNKFKNAFESVYHFACQPKIKFYPWQVQELQQPQSTARGQRKLCGQTQNKSGFFNGPSLGKVKYAYPTNVLNFPNIINQYSTNKWHPAVFPITLPSFFINAFTKKGDVVYDPFAGSGTTCKACVRLERNFIASEIKKEFFKLAQKDINAEYDKKKKENLH